MHIGGSQDPPEIKEDTIMAQVTMTSQEYLEMVDTVRSLKQLEKDMLDNVEVELNLESNYNKCIIEIVPTFTAKIQKQVVSKIVGVITAEPVVMDHLFKENNHFLNIKNGYISSNWDDRPKEHEVDLFTDKTFKAAWDKAKQRAEEAEAVDAELMDKEEE